MSSDLVFTGKVIHFDTEDTVDRRTHRCKFNTARGPLDPLTTAVLDQPPGRAARRLAPPGRLKRDLMLFTANVRNGLLNFKPS